mmetsp:Transcript_21375/g.48705  ORF Transcript_21375/g.48705 Transcript_21375/m.48705 type:complete len:570 (+) Transcript_21375:1-1710(+)
MQVQTYWLANFTFDFLVYLAPLVCAFSVLFLVPFLKGSISVILAMGVVMALYGPATILHTFAWSRRFDSTLAAQGVVLSTNLVLGPVLIVVVNIFAALSLLTAQEDNYDNKYSVAAYATTWVGRILCPGFAFGSGLARASISAACSAGLAKTAAQCNCIDLWAWDLPTDAQYYTPVTNPGGLLPEVAALAGHILVWGLVVFRPNALPPLRAPRYDGVDGAVGDATVAAEEQRAQALGPNDATLLVRRARKQHQGHDGPVRAVRGVTFAAPASDEAGEIFGILGPNGAGKTTLFNAMTGQDGLSDGEIYIAGNNVALARRECWRDTGYVPQFDALWPSITVSQHLRIYCALRGIPKPEVDTVVDQQIRRWCLGSFRRSPAGGLSGGNRRKLMLAIATIGHPRVLFLDEPSCGMDPMARRQAWELFHAYAAGTGTVVVLTTHSIDEAEALCGRIAIQVHGQFRAVASAPEIKNTHGTLDVVLSREGAVELAGPEVLASLSTREGVVYVDGETELVEALRGAEPPRRLVVQQVPQGPLFRALEEARNQGRVSDYAVHQPDLEQVFNDMAERG